MLQRLRSSPDRWVVLVVIATIELTLAAVFAVQHPDRYVLGLLLNASVAVWSAWATRARIKRPPEPDLDPWGRYEAASERLAEHRRG